MFGLPELKNLKTKTTMNATNTSPMKFEGKSLTRRFLGKTENFENKRDQQFNQSMLKAYLKGASVFYFGFRRTFSGLKPVEHEVKQEYFYR